jgi:hypothetical protein
LDAIPAVLAVVVLQVVTELLVGRNYALALLFITPMAMLMGQIAAPPDGVPFVRPRIGDRDRRGDRAADHPGRGSAPPPGFGNGPR